MSEIAAQRNAETHPRRDSWPSPNASGGARIREGPLDRDICRAARGETDPSPPRLAGFLSELPRRARPSTVSNNRLSRERRGMPGQYLQQFGSSRGMENAATRGRPSRMAGDAGSLFPFPSAARCADLARARESYGVPIGFPAFWTREIRQRGVHPLCRRSRVFWRRGVRSPLRAIRDACRAPIALEGGFHVNRHKTRIMRQGVRQCLAGIVVNRTPSLRRHDLELLEAILTNCLRRDPDSQNRDRHPDFRAHLEGRVGFVEMINREKGRKLRELFQAIRWNPSGVP